VRTLSGVTRQTPAPAKTAKKAVAGKPPKPPKKPLTRKQKIWRVVMWIALVFVCLILLGLIVFVILYQSINVPDPNASFRTETSYIYYDDGKSEIGQFALQNRDSIPYSQMPQTVKDAVVAAENRTFWTDHGIDPKGILRAAFSNARGNSTQGASTITQQYVKILYLNQERSYKRKIKEAILSLKIQRQMSKQEILEGYLNTIYFGRGAYGIQAASEAFFDKPAAKLNLKQSAVLASVLNNPSAFDPSGGADNKERLLERYRYVLDGMADMGTITDDQAEKAEAKLPKFPHIKQTDAYGGEKGHALTLVKKELLQLGFTEDQIEGGGLRVTTTLNQKAMAADAQAEAAERPAGFSDKVLHVGIANVDVKTGALIGFFGGQDFLKSQLNWASTGGMVGSSMKPVTLATALEAGYSLKDTFYGNSPYTFPGGLEVHNDGEGNGYSYGTSVSAEYALQESINTAFVDMTMGIPDGPEKIYQNALKMGLPPDKADPDYPGIPDHSIDLLPTDTLITLGKAIESPINMANLYATIANGGVRNNVHVISKVTDASGDVLYQFHASPTRAIPAPIADDVMYAMQQVVKAGTGTNALALGRPAAGKTGTATNDDNATTAAWFTGYTPQVSTSVVYTRGKGNEPLSGWLPDAFGSGYPTLTWTAAMKAIVADMPVEDFPPPAYVDGDAPTKGHAPEPSETVSTAPPKSAKPSKGPSQPPSSPPPSESASTEPSEPSDPSTSSEPSSSVTP